MPEARPQAHASAPARQQVPSQGPDGAAPRSHELTSMPSLQDIAAQVSGYDPNALPVAQAQEFIARLVPRVRGGRDAVAALVARPRAGARPRLAIQRAGARQLGDGRLRAARQRARPQTRRRGCALAGTGSPASPSPATCRARQCLRITTGAVMPAGLDTVVPQEFVTLDGDVVIVPAGVVRTGDNRRLAGEDLAARQRRAAAGRVLRPADLGPDRLAGHGRGAGAAPPARRVLLHRRRAALDRRAARRGLRLRQQPLHAVGHAAAPERRAARHGRGARRSRRARGGIPPGRRQPPTR